MASKSLSVAIALDGAKEIEKQLADIGAAGEKAFKDIEKAAKAAGGFDQIKPEQVTAKLKELGVVGEEAFNKITAAVATATRTERLVGSVKTVETGIKVLSGSMLGLIRAFGPLGLAIGVAGTAFSKLANFASDAAEAIGKVDAAAAKVGLGIQQYDKLRAALQNSGISAKSAEDAIQKVADATEKVKLDQVAEAAKKLQAVMAAGSDPRTSNLLQPLLTMAQGIGPVADAAKAALAGLNIQFTEEEQRLQRMAASGTQSLEQLAAGFNGPVVAGRAWVQGVTQLAAGTDRAGAILQAFVVQLEAIKDPAERNKVAFQQLGQAGLEIARGISTGAISSKQSIDELTKNVTLLGEQGANSAAKLEQSFNRSAAAWERFKTTGDATELGTIFTELATRVSISFGVMGQEIATLGAKLGELAAAVGGAIWDTFASAGTAAISAVSGALDGLISKLREAAQLAAKLFAAGGGGTPGGAAPGLAGGGRVGGRGSGTSDSNLAWLSRGEYVMPARVASQPGMLAFLEALRRSGNIPGYAAGGGIGAGGLQILEDFPLIAQMLKNLMDFIAEMGDAEESVRKLTEFGRKWHLNFASGGVVGGRGTGTSDSNLAWVSRGEHVMPAAVVRQPGVLALLEALRRGGDLRRLLDGMGRFAMGGPVAMPTLAGGLGGGGNLGTLTLGLPSGGSVNVRATSAVVEQLQREAAMAQVRSGGRKPSRYT